MVPCSDDEFEGSYESGFRDEVLEITGNIYQDNYARYGKSVVVIGHDGEVDMSDSEFDIAYGENNNKHPLLK